MRPEIERLLQLGPLPAESEASIEHLRQLEEALHSVAKPVSDEEARALVKLFGPDNCFGLAWSFLHLIESASGWPLVDCLASSDNDWVASLRDRAIRGGVL
ncbi:hypothetical protein [Pseudorhodoferax sp. Leaf267]|uniref:hypothetical protein n=1 Tax=Pseudorhodoferax sp. Leaf267 TaxID=1736316 RepID=UPI0012E27079|nr:hypothetical protein [Pseudorhodoferax sp. Leaf267]